MKIIINQPRASYFVGGAELVSFEHAVNFLKLGNEVHFFTISPKSIGLEYSSQFKDFQKNFADRITIVEINQHPRAVDVYKIQPGENQYRWNVESIHYNKKLYNTLYNFNEEFDVIFSYYNLDAVFVPENKVKKSILYLCGTPKQKDDFQGSFLSAYDKVIAISDTVKQYWQMYRKSQIEVISTGVDFEKFSPLKHKLNNGKTIKLLYVGRLIARKNVDKIIHAYEKLKNKYPLSLTIVGDGPEREQLEAISQSTIFTGVVANTEDYYKNSDIFISPSEYGEGVQGVMLEAMSCQMTIVATNSDINKTLLENERGFVVEPTIDSVVSGIEKALTANRKEIGQKSRQFILENYNWLEITKKIQEHI